MEQRRLLLLMLLLLLLDVVDFCGGSSAGTAHTSKKSVVPVPQLPATIDVVIAVSRRGDARGIINAKVKIKRCADRDNGELKYVLRSIRKNAPWVRMIFLLINGPEADPKMTQVLAEPHKTRIIDRCTLLPPGQCPTRNGFTVQSVLHKVPGLAEHFLYTDDDTLLGLPAQISDFFDRSGRPKVWQPLANHEAVYHDQQSTGLSIDDTPRRFPTRYVWSALTVSGEPIDQQQYPLRLLVSHFWLLSGLAPIF
jgi:hypothetical protein